MAVALKEGRAVRGAEAVAERPDGTRVPFIPFPTPLRDSFGRITGAINMLVDISERRQAETQQRLLLDELNHRTKNNMQMLQSLLFSAARTAHSEEARKVLNEASARIAAMAAAQRVLYGRSDATRFGRKNSCRQSAKPSGNCCRRIRELIAASRAACFPTTWRCRSP
jgi:PAS domain-containing protein